jgi:acetoin utilization deacetylase AcuC-like enzyme
MHTDHPAHPFTPADSAGLTSPRRCRPRVPPREHWLRAAWLARILPFRRSQSGTLTTTRSPALLSRITVYYDDRMVVTDVPSFSPSAEKPRLVVRDWIAAGLPIALRPVRAATSAQLALAHDRRFVDGVLSGRLHNGFGNTLPAVAQSLPFTNGAMVAASREALANGRVACAPVSGFHHSGYCSAGDFCTFNGLMVAVMTLRQEGLARNVAILDLDHHYGNGTDDIIRKLGVTGLEHFTSGEHGLSANDAEPFLRDLPGRIRAWAGCSLLLYQAGADAHVDDPLGGWMTTDQLARRDRIVFETAAAIGLPVAWNLAGGYQKDAAGGIAAVLEIHRNTMRACVDVYATATVAGRKAPAP